MHAGIPQKFTDVLTNAATVSFSRDRVRIRSPPSVAILSLYDGAHPGSSTIIHLSNVIAKHKIQIMKIPGQKLSRSLIRRFRLSMEFA